MPGRKGDDAAARRVRVWDLPTRFFHWLLVALVLVSVFTGNVGGLTGMDVHMWSGYAIMALVLFRFAWGVAGSRHSRFAAFLRGPRAVLAYARGLVQGGHQSVLGHNPMGGWSVVALLTSLLVQATTGLFANDDILTEGPLAKHVSKAMSDRLTAVHEVNANLLYLLIALHLAAVFGYLLIKKDNLIRPMLSGRKRITAADAALGAAEEEAFVSPWRAALILGFAIGIVCVVVTR